MHLAGAQGLMGLSHVSGLHRYQCCCIWTFDCSLCITALHTLVIFNSFFILNLCRISAGTACSLFPMHAWYMRHTSLP
jgi:hypothetical protein